MVFAVQEIGPVVPEHGCRIVSAGRAHEEVEVFPAGGGLGGYRGSGPFADDEGDGGEVVADVGEVGFEGCFVGRGAPGGASPGGKDKGVYMRSTRLSRRDVKDGKVLQGE